MKKQWFRINEYIVTESVYLSGFVKFSYFVWFELLPKGEKKKDWSLRFPSHRFPNGSRCGDFVACCPRSIKHNIFLFPACRLVNFIHSRKLAFILLFLFLYKVSGFSWNSLKIFAEILNQYIVEIWSQCLFSVCFSILYAFWSELMLFLFWEK